MIPEEHESLWDIAGPIEVSHVYLTDERLRAVADVLYEGRSFELINRIAFDDPAAARILELLSEEAATGEFVAALRRTGDRPALYPAYSRSFIAEQLEG